MLLLQAVERMKEMVQVRGPSLTAGVIMQTLALDCRSCSIVRNHGWGILLLTWHPLPC